MKTQQASPRVIFREAINDYWDEVRPDRDETIETIKIIAYSAISGAIICSGSYAVEICHFIASAANTLFPGV